MVNILVVEDDEKLNSTVCAHLAEHGYQAIGSGCLSVQDSTYGRLLGHRK